MESQAGVSLKTAKYSKYLLKALDLLESLEEGNKSANAKTNYTQNAHASLIGPHKGWDDGDADTDVSTHTANLLEDMRQDRKQIDEDLLINRRELAVVYPSISTQHHQANETQLWIDKADSEITKAMCASPRQRLKRLEAEVNRVGRKQVTHSKPDSRGYMKSNIQGVVSPKKEQTMMDDYDWTLPNLELPVEFCNLERTTVTSEREPKITGAVKCSPTGSPSHLSPVNVKNSPEIMGWRANKIGNDYKFTRLSSDEDLQLFIEQHTLQSDDNSEHRRVSDIVYNDTSRKFEIPSTHYESEQSRKSKNKQSDGQKTKSRKAKKDK